MKQRATAGLAAVFILAVLLAGCGGAKVDEEALRAHARNETLVADCGRVADAVMLDVVNPVAPLQRSFTGVGVVDGQDVLIYRALAAPSGLDQGGYVAVSVDKAALFFAYGTELMKADFYKVRLESGQTAQAVYTLQSDAADLIYAETMGDGEGGEGGEGEGGGGEWLADFSYSISAQWLANLRERTVDDWQRRRADGDDYWCTQYADNAMIFLSESGTVFPGSLSAVEQLEGAVDAYEPAGGDRLLFDVICELYGLDRQAYYDLLTYVMDR